MIVQEIDKIKFFFLHGRPRSGTTLLSMVLSAHPNLAMSMETKLVAELYFRFKSVKKWNENKILELYDFIFTLPRIKFVEFDNDKLKSDLLLLGKDANLSRLIKVVYLNILSNYPKEKIIWIGDKTPNYSIQKHYLKIFKELFPETKVVHLSRDYRDHYLSVQKVDFKFKQRAIVAYRWIYSHKIITDEYASEKDNYYFIRHEDLVSKPEKYLSEICSFLGVDYRPEILEFYKIKDEIINKVPKDLFEKFHSRLLQPITDKYIYAWKTKLDDEIVREMDSIVGEYAEQVGYQRKYKEKPNTFLFWYVKTMLNFVAFLTKQNDKLPYALRKFFNYPIAVFSHIYIKFLKI
jgi:hypothetical protein